MPRCVFINADEEVGYWAPKRSSIGNDPPPSLFFVRRVNIARRVRTARRRHRHEDASPSLRTRRLLASAETAALYVIGLNKNREKSLSQTRFPIPINFPQRQQWGEIVLKSRISVSIQRTLKIAEPFEIETFTSSNAWKYEKEACFQLLNAFGRHTMSSALPPSNGDRTVVRIRSVVRNCDTGMVASIKCTIPSWTAPGLWTTAQLL